MGLPQNLQAWRPLALSTLIMRFCLTVISVYKVRHYNYNIEKIILYIGPLNLWWAYNSNIMFLSHLWFLLLEQQWLESSSSVTRVYLAPDLNPSIKHVGNSRKKENLAVTKLHVWYSSNNCWQVVGDSPL